MGRLVKFTFRAAPLQKTFWGTLLFEVNFTGWRCPFQKYLRVRLEDLVIFTFASYPLQNALKISKEMFGVSDYCVFLQGQLPQEAFAEVGLAILI